MNKTKLFAVFGAMLLVLGGFLFVKYSDAPSEVDLSIQTESERLLVSNEQTNNEQGDPTVVEVEPVPVESEPIPVNKVEPEIVPKVNAESEISGFTLIQIAQHNTRNDCWTTIEGKVYDITSYIPHHPGGPEVAELACGIDSTELYKSEKDHFKASGKAARELEKLYIGELLP